MFQGSRLGKKTKIRWYFDSRFEQKNYEQWPVKTIKWITNQKHLLEVDIDRIPIVRDETPVFHFER